ncbi:hypothetical protein [Salmonella enterica]|uniref:hypothetical protein n=1 Tax=Salmonella enterica TaxID=28901 RepID=UPI00398C4C36
MKKQIIEAQDEGWHQREGEQNSAKKYEEGGGNWDPRWRQDPAEQDVKEKHRVTKTLSTIPTMARKLKRFQGNRHRGLVLKQKTEARTAQNFFKPVLEMMMKAQRSFYPHLPSGINAESG